MKRRLFSWLLMLLLLFTSLPAMAETNAGGEGVAILPAGTYRMEELEEAPFDFSGVAGTYVYWLDRAGKERITVCRFGSEADFAANRSRIQGYGLTGPKGLRYPDCELPYTWFVSEELRSIALYEGTDEDVRFAREGHCQLLKKYSPEGGYFLDFFLDLPRLPKAKSLEFLDEEGGLIVIMKPAMEYHKTMKELIADTDAVCIGRVTKAPEWPDIWGGIPETRYHRIAETWRYEIEVLESISGINAKSIRLSGLQPGCLAEGYTYLLFLKLTERENGSVRVTLADTAAPSAFEIDDRGGVLPIWNFRDLPEGRIASRERFVRRVRH